MDMPTEAARLAARPMHNSTDARRVPWFAPAGVCLALAGCAAGSKLDTIPSDGPTMAQIYRQHLIDTGRHRSPGGSGTLPQRGVDEAPAIGVRYGAAEIAQRFARLPNPDLVMYVAPHLSPNGRYPIPGYSTVFPMYETVEYAMPGEVQVRRAVDGAAATAGDTSMPAALQASRPMPIDAAR